MSDLLETGITWLADMLKARAGRTIIYRRGNMEVTVTATVGHTLLRLSDGQGGTRMEWTDRDLLIRASDLILAGVITIPIRGDQVIDGETVYEVAASGGEPAWRYSDPFKKILRIHTKEVKNG